VLPSNVQHFHQAMIMKRNKILAVSHNILGSRSRGCGFSDQTMHAEKSVVKNLGDLSQLNGATLFVYRFNAHNELRDSKPCPDCQQFLEKCMREYGLRKVVYSVEK
jgi:hypothetical protein